MGWGRARGKGRRGKGQGSRVSRARVSRLRAGGGQARGMAGWARGDLEEDVAVAAEQSVRPGLVLAVECVHAKLLLLQGALVTEALPRLSPRPRGKDTALH